LIIVVVLIIPIARLHRSEGAVIRGTEDDVYTTTHYKQTNTRLEIGSSIFTNYTNWNSEMVYKKIENADIEDDEVTRWHRTDIGWGRLNEEYNLDDDI
jgi:hypothetical protein